MRLTTCILLACIATSLANEHTRDKRDLQFWKDVIAAKLGLISKHLKKEENVKILRIPGFDQVVVRAVPKVTVLEPPVPETIVQVDPTMAILQSYLGTRTPQETLLALQETKHLLQSGILNARQEVVELAPQKQPVYVLPTPILQQKFNFVQPRPVMVEKAVFPVPPPVLTSIPAPQPLQPILPRFPVLPPLSPPKFVEPEIKPLPIVPLVPAPLPPLVPVPANYSYKQKYPDRSVTSYTSEGNQDVIITEVRQPPPPPPSFIIDRFQKLIYGMPLGTTVPIPPPVADVLVGPFYPEGIIISKPSEVDIKISRPENKTKNTMKVRKPPIIVKEDIVVPGSFVVDIPGAPLVVPPPPPLLIKAPEDDIRSSHKHFHVDGSNYERTVPKPVESILWEPVSKMPPPPPLIIERIEAVSENAKRPISSGRYTMKIANGVGSFENDHGNKIYYSRLESPLTSDESAFPFPLRSTNKVKTKHPNSNTKLDEFGKPFISTKLPDETTESEEYNGPAEKGITARPEIEPIKKIPKLPMPLAAGNEASVGSKYSYKVVNGQNPNDIKFSISSETPSDLEIKKNKDVAGFGSQGFSYTQVDHDGTINTFTENGKDTRPAVEVVKKFPALPAPMLGDVEPAPKLKPPEVSNGVSRMDNYRYTYKQTNENGNIITTIAGNQEEKVMVPSQPAAIVDIIQSKSKSIPCVSRKVCKNHSTGIGHAPSKASSVIVNAGEKHSSGFSYTQIDNGVVTQFTDGEVKKPVLVEAVPVRPAAVVDVIQSLSKPKVVKVNQDNPSRVVMFEEPVVSRYVYKQISHNNPQPFTVVNVEDKPRIGIPSGDVQVKVNKHEHVRPDGTRYPCVEVHRVPVPIAPISPIPSAHVVATVPEGLIYVPPKGADAPASTSHFSYTQMSSGSSTETSSTTTASSQLEDSSSEEPTSLSLHPIVVAPEETKYSYTQKNSDGSSLNVLGDKKEVSVTVEDGDKKSSHAGRGDIPESAA